MMQDDRLVDHSLRSFEMPRRKKENLEFNDLYNIYIIYNYIIARWSNQYLPPNSRSRKSDVPRASANQNGIEFFLMAHR